MEMGPALHARMGHTGKKLGLRMRGSCAVRCGVVTCGAIRCVAAAGRQAQLCMLVVEAAHAHAMRRRRLASQVTPLPAMRRQRRMCVWMNTRVVPAWSRGGQAPLCMHTHTNTCMHVTIYDVL